MRTSPQPTVIASTWWTPPIPPLDVITQALINPSASLCIGAVAVQIDYDGTWKCYIGYGTGEDEEADANRIRDWGVPLGFARAAIGLFPQLDSNKYAS